MHGTDEQKNEKEKELVDFAQRKGTLIYSKVRNHILCRNKRECPCSAPVIRPWHDSPLLPTAEASRCQPVPPTFSLLIHALLPHPT
jgi:hypothetical protein